MYKNTIRRVTEHVKCSMRFSKNDHDFECVSENIRNNHDFVLIVWIYYLHCTSVRRQCYRYSPRASQFAHTLYNKFFFQITTYNLSANFNRLVVTSTFQIDYKKHVVWLVKSTYFIIYNPIGFIFTEIYYNRILNTFGHKRTGTRS